MNIQSIESLLAELDRVKAERDEADLRAGAAERSYQREREATSARDSWRRKAKRQWGVDDSVSFDVVWAEAIAQKEQITKLIAERDEAVLIHQLDTGTESAIAALQEQVEKLTAERDAYKKALDSAEDQITGLKETRNRLTAERDHWEQTCHAQWDNYQENIIPKLTAERDAALAELKNTESRLHEVAKHCATVEKQRDDLLAALEKAANEIRRCDYTPARSTLLVAIDTIDKELK